MQTRVCRWLVTFCVGLIAAAIVVEHFETLIGTRHPYATFNACMGPLPKHAVWHTYVDLRMARACACASFSSVVMPARVYTVRREACTVIVLCASVCVCVCVLAEKHVQLSFFVPLIMGHGGNTGSQTVSSVIRAIALRQVRWRTSLPAVMKEALAGGMMGE